MTGRVMATSDGTWGIPGGFKKWNAALTIRPRRFGRRRWAMDGWMRWKPYCWWFRNPANHPKTNPVNNGVFTISTGAGVLNQQQKFLNIMISSRSGTWWLWLCIYKYIYFFLFTHLFECIIILVYVWKKHHAFWQQNLSFCSQSPPGWTVFLSGLRKSMSGKCPTRGEKSGGWILIWIKPKKSCPRKNHGNIAWL